MVCWLLKGKGSSSSNLRFDGHKSSFALALHSPPVGRLPVSRPSREQPLFCKEYSICRSDVGWWRQKTSKACKTDEARVHRLAWLTHLRFFSSAEFDPSLPGWWWGFLCLLAQRRSPSHSSSSWLKSEPGQRKLRRANIGQGKGCVWVGAIFSQEPAFTDESQASGTRRPVQSASLKRRHSMARLCKTEEDVESIFKPEKKWRWLWKPKKWAGEWFGRGCAIKYHYKVEEVKVSTSADEMLDEREREESWKKEWEEQVGFSVREALVECEERERFPSLGGRRERERERQWNGCWRRNVLASGEEEEEGNVFKMLSNWS